MILEQLRQRGRLTVRTIQPLAICYRDCNSHTECWDKSRDTSLEIENIDDSYRLDVVHISDDVTEVMIPRGAKCTLIKSSPNVDCTLDYINIETDLVFEEEPIESFFEIIDD